MKGVVLFAGQLRTRPLGAVAGLVVEYLGFVAGCLFALLLLVTRVPLRAVDRITRLDVRRRVIDAIARVSPG
jgi:hypothetical protein